MKNLSFLLLAAALALTACGSHNSGGTPPDGQVVAFDLPAECQGPQADYESLPNWSAYEAAGCSEYNWDSGHFRHGGCPHGMFAACAPGAGMVCMPQDVYRDHQVAWYNYRDGAPRMSFCGFEGASNQGACSYRGTQGAGQIGRACLVGDVNACGLGSCQPIGSSGSRNRHNSRRGGNGPRIGVCVQ